MPEKWRSDPIKDFFLLRPLFTPAMLKIVWWLVLLVWIFISVLPTVLGVLDAYRASMPVLATATYLIADFLLKFLCLILVRVLLEVALALSLRSSKES